MSEKVSSVTLVYPDNMKELREENPEQKCHDNEWTIEEDALAFLTDAALVGRLTMSQQGRWPINGETESELEHKLGECIWWLIILLIDTKFIISGINHITIFLRR